MTTDVIENIRKMMGWCPNVDLAENKKTLQFNSIAVNAPGSGGGLTQASLGWSNKYRNRILQVSVILTLMAMVLYNSYARKNPELFLAGMI